VNELQYEMFYFCCMQEIEKSGTVKDRNRLRKREQPSSIILHNQRKTTSIYI